MKEVNKKRELDSLSDNFFSKNKKAQIWVETVIYTLIAFAMIAMVLSYAKPKIEEAQDKAVLEQSIRILQEIDLVISEINQGVPGNKREIGLTIKKGTLKIDAENNRIFFEMDSKYQYSELDTEITDGNLIIFTRKKADFNVVNLTRDYNEDYNLTYQGEKISKALTKAPTQYNLFISNDGKDGASKTKINFNIN
jgi:hypothetical protein